jgi:SAM-dependent methyltransferase
VYLPTKLTTLFRLLFGNKQDRKYLLYFLGLLFRGIDVSSVSVEALGLTQGRSECYGNSGGPELDAVLSRIPISPADSVLDVGCGKGGAMITMSKYGFGRVDGVEISRRLAAIAEKHLARAKVANASVYCCDAADFKDLDPYTVLYMYHPFGDVVLGEVLKNVAASLARQPRRLTLLYRNPIHHDLVVQAGFSQTGKFTHCKHPFHVYERDGQLDGSVG